MSNEKQNIDANQSQSRPNELITNADVVSLVNEVCQQQQQVCQVQLYHIVEKINRILNFLRTHVRPIRHMNE
jgi:uncharacterized FlaG/YvyC family protein